MPDKSIKPYDKPAGGWDSLKRSWQALRDEGIVMRGAKALLRTNQNEGFDCPGCAKRFASTVANATNSMTG